MDIARLVLDYLKVLVWPIVVATALLSFRRQIRDMASRVTRLNILGNEIEAVVHSGDIAIQEALDAIPPTATAQPDDLTESWLNPTPPAPVSDDATQRAYEVIDAVERRVRQLAFSTDPSLFGRSTIDAIAWLSDKRILQPSIRYPVTELLSLRAECRVLSAEEANQILRTAQQMSLLLQVVADGQGRTRTRVVGDPAPFPYPSSH
ncbi:hypothetical protein [Streptomyces sp. NBC_00063]|uniref:hypothetical protein n=1 Tax=Streptomyces sp. NBC_00063 TaxID=2975638 RepID=UPI003D715CD8